MSETTKVELTLEVLPVNTKFTYNNSDAVYNRIQQGGCCGMNAYWAWDIDRNHPLFINLNTVVNPVLYSIYIAPVLPEAYTELLDWYKSCNHIILNNENCAEFLEYLISKYDRPLYLQDRWQVYLNDDIEKYAIYIGPNNDVVLCEDIGSLHVLVDNLASGK